MSSISNRTKPSVEENRRQYKELKRGGSVDPSLPQKEIKSFIDGAKAEDESCRDMEEEAEDMLIDVTFIIKEGCCSPTKAKSIR